MAYHSHLRQGCDRRSSCTQWIPAIPEQIQSSLHGCSVCFTRHLTVRVPSLLCSVSGTIGKVLTVPGLFVCWREHFNLWHMCLIAVIIMKDKMALSLQTDGHFKNSTNMFIFARYCHPGHFLDWHWRSQDYTRDYGIGEYIRMIK